MIYSFFHERTVKVPSSASPWHLPMLSSPVNKRMRSLFTRLYPLSLQNPEPKPPRMRPKISSLTLRIIKDISVQAKWLISFCWKRPTKMLQPTTAAVFRHNFRKHQKCELAIEDISLVINDLADHNLITIIAAILSQKTIPAYRSDLPEAVLVYLVIWEKLLSVLTHTNTNTVLCIV